MVYCENNESILELGCRSIHVAKKNSLYLKIDRKDMAE
jgi:hypothetical protein